MTSHRYPLAPNGIYDAIQGEGVMLGVPMTFIRLAGCSVNCTGCDTDYSVAERLTVAEIVERVQRLPWRKWVWITGGEPTDHDLRPFMDGLRQLYCQVAVATAGIRPVVRGRLQNGPDFLSVSPHSFGASWVQRRGDQLNLVFGLNGLRACDWPEDLSALVLSDIPENRDSGFPVGYATPCDGQPETLAECVAFVRAHPGFRLGLQAHKAWNLP